MKLILRIKKYVLIRVIRVLLVVISTRMTQLQATRIRAVFKRARELRKDKVYEISSQ